MIAFLSFLAAIKDQNMIGMPNAGKAGAYLAIFETPSERRNAPLSQALSLVMKPVIRCLRGPEP